MSKRINWELDTALQFFYPGRAYGTKAILMQALWDYRVNKSNGHFKHAVIPENQMIFQATILRKLIHEKYLFELNDHNYILLIEGSIFFESPPWIYKFRPYAYEKFKKNIEVAWSVLKVIAIILNALAILYIGWIAASNHNG